MATYIIQRCFADPAQIKALQDRISAGQAAGKDVSQLQRTLSRLQTEVSRVGSTGSTVIAGQVGGNAAVANVINPYTAQSNIARAAESVSSQNTEQIFKNAYNKGASSVGMKQGFQNSWRNMSGMGKAGVVAGGALLAGMAIKGATSIGGNKEKDNRGQSY